MNMPDDKNDDEYKREFFKTSIDAQKILKGIYGNYVTESIMENFVKSINFDTKFPIKKVKKRFDTFCFI